MTRLRRTLAVLAAVASVAPALAAQGLAYALVTLPGNRQQLVRFATNDPLSVTTIGFTGVTLTGLDVRPATGMLYGHDGRDLFLVDPTTGVASRVATVSTAITGNGGFDFNPTVDRIRIVSPAGTNLRVNPVTGEAIVDGAYRYGAGDANSGATPSFSAMAYTNSDADPNTGTALFGIDAQRGTLVRVAAPNGGDVFTVGSLGLGMNPMVTAFDILTSGGTNTAFITVNMGEAASRLYTVDLATGAASLAGTIGTMRAVDALAVTAVPEPASVALVGAGLAALVPLVRARRRRAHG